MASAQLLRARATHPPPCRPLALAPLVGLLLLCSTGFVSAYLVKPSPLGPPASHTPTPPPRSATTGLDNRLYEWRGQHVRYQVVGPSDPDAPTAVLIHGLFSNSDHFRKTLRGLADAGYRAYALDLLGCGYSSKPDPRGVEAMGLNGENGRFHERYGSTRDDGDGEDVHGRAAPYFVDVNFVPPPSRGSAVMKSSWGATKKKVPPIVKDVELGTSDGKTRVRDVDLRHPLGSCYNFYTWSEQVVDFVKDVVLADHTPPRGSESHGGKPRTTLVSNSKGTLVSIQALLDQPDIFDGVFCLNPTFREMHAAEMPFPFLTKPLFGFVQRYLRNRGHGLYKSVAEPDTVRKILKEPYAVEDAVDDELVGALLDPLLLPNADNVVFDVLSYGGGPLLEQQLQAPNFPTLEKAVGLAEEAHAPPVWIVYGDEDPWLPGKRVERLASLDAVERVVPLPGLGHCPFDERPEVVHPVLLEFLGQVKKTAEATRSGLLRSEWRSDPSYSETSAAPLRTAMDECLTLQ